MKRSTLFLISFTSILVIGGFITYWYLGGFEDPEFEQLIADPIYISGQYYEGKVRDKAIAGVFDKYDSIAKKGGYTLAAAFYNEPEKNDGIIKAFIGVIVSDSLATDNPGEKTQYFASLPIVRSRLKASYMLAPVKVYNQLAHYAKEKNILIDEFSIEIYPSENELIVEVPIIKK